MTLEKDPAKASSDPGYYGRDYVFGGDVVVENSSVRAAFSAARGSVRIWAKPDVTVGEIAPIKGGPVQRFELIRNAADEVVLELEYGKGASATFGFGKDGIAEVKASEALGGWKVNSAIEHAIVPGFVGDDLIYSGKEAAPIPSENILVSLLEGEKAMLVTTWTAKGQKVALNGGGFEIAAGGEPVYFAAIAAPGIWHREKLDVSFLEKDVALAWKPPFSAKWQTHLLEGSVKTKFAFREAKGTVWRGLPGSYDYPVWFEGGRANFHLSKKVPPKGDALIYFLEPHDTPASILTPVDVLKATLGRSAAESIVDVAGRKLRTHHGVCGSGVHRACTCGYTEAIQAVFEKGEETDQKAYIDQSVKDMIYFVQQHLERIDEYRAFAKGLTDYLRATAKAQPELKEYLDGLEESAQQIPQEYDNQKENMKSVAFAAELEQQTMALTGKKDPQNLKRYMELLKAWRAMGGAQDYVVAQYHTLTRKLFQDAAYNCGTDAKAVEAAQEVRARCKEILRNPDGYEIWPNY
jgi:hypothetical protein